ncbi:MAG TPA: hypothetical protein PK668_11660 [Myxococcota bacterium]|nr:hypothetical protein [Myxococcota bacterium]HRY93176.1 hypothetical protein [Myxococcota bacterium]HSA21669.1 hypothetical protein [Myxococcota bacterium]
MRLVEFALALGLGAAAALAAAGCEAGQPGTAYRCTCQVTCDGSTSTWVTEVCRQESNPRAVADIASENCEAVHAATCAQVTCACTGCQAQGELEEC